MSSPPKWAVKVGAADMAMAGGNDPSGLADALAQVPAWVQSQLTQ